MLEETRWPLWFNQAGINYHKDEFEPVIMLRHCNSCHDPVGLITGLITKKDYVKNIKNRSEGVTCVVCHNISEGSKHGGGGGDYKISFSTQGLFEYSQNFIGKYLNNKLIMANPTAHKKKMKKDFMHKSDYCLGCHKILQHSSWQNSEYNNTDFNGGKQCQTCHMPKIEMKNEISAYKTGKASSHRFLAAGYTLADIYKHKNQKELTQNFIKDKKVSLQLITPEKFLETKDFPIEIRVINKGVGHYFPSGTESDIIEAWLEIHVRDGEKTILHLGKLDKNNYLDENIFVYRATAYDSKNNKLSHYRHESWLFSYLSSTLIEPKKIHRQNFSIESNKLEGAKSLIIDVKLNYRRPNQQYADWVFGKGKYLVKTMLVSQKMLTLKRTDSGKEFEHLLTKYRNQNKIIDKNLEQIFTTEKKESKLNLVDLIALSQIRTLLKEKKIKQARKIYQRLKPAIKEKSFVKKLRIKLQRRHRKDDFR